MRRPLNTLQQNAYDTVKARGSIKKGDGWTIATARVLASRGLVDLEERRNAAGKVYFWRARRTAPAAITPSSTRKPVPAGTNVVRVGVRNPQTEAVTYTSVHHVHDSEGLRGALRTLGVPERDMGQGTGGKYTTEDGRRVFVWRDLEAGALREFVCGGDVYRIQPHPTGEGTWAAVHLDTGEAVAADPSPDEAERRAREDAAAFHRALRRAQ